MGMTICLLGGGFLVEVWVFGLGAKRGGRGRPDGLPLRISVQPVYHRRGQPLKTQINNAKPGIAVRAAKTKTGARSRPSSSMTSFAILALLTENLDK